MRTKQMSGDRLSCTGHVQMCESRTVQRGFVKGKGGSWLPRKRLIGVVNKSGWA